MGLNLDCYNQRNHRKQQTTENRAAHPWGFPMQSTNNLPINLLARYQDDDDIRSVIQIEAETDLEGFKQIQQVQTLLSRALHQLLLGIGLGLGHNAALRCGEQLLFAHLSAHLQTPSTEQQDYLWQALELEARGDSRSIVDEHLQQLIRELLSPGEWEAIAIAASEELRQKMVDQWPLLKTA
jgi:hypothetical protein